MKLKTSVISAFTAFICIFSAASVFAATYNVGDVDCDGRITIMDATAIQKHLAGISSTYYAHLADFDRDGKVTIMDSTEIQKYVAGSVIVYENYIISIDGKAASVVKYFGAETNAKVPGTLSGYSVKIDTINSNAFVNNSALKTVTVPVTVSKINDYAFKNCSSLTTVYSYNQNLKWGNSFIDCPKFQSIRFL